MLNGEPINLEQLARMVGGQLDEVEKHINEMKSCGTFSQKKNGVLFSRRMVRDEIEREKKSKAGKLGMKSRYNKNDNKTVTPLEYEYGNENSPKDIEESNSEKLSFGESVDIGWSAIPENRQRAKGKFTNAWIDKVISADVDLELVCNALSAYYGSDEGRGKFHRQPASLILDEIWNESKGQWGKNRGEEKFPESPFDHEKIIKKYIHQFPDKKPTIDAKLENGESENQIAYQIWKKYPSCR